MDIHNQIDCFDKNIKFFRWLGVWPTDSGKYYRYYALIFITIFVVIYDISYTINFIFLPRKMEIFIEDIILYLTIVSTASKVVTFYLSHEEILEMLDVIESDTFQPDTEEGKKIINETKQFNIKFWKMFAVVSLISNGTHVSIPILAHLVAGVELHLPVFSCDFIPEDIKKKFIYPLYLYESVGMHFVVWYTVNVDCMFIGLMNFIIAQLKILNIKLQNVTTNIKKGDEKEQESIQKLNDCIMHYDKVARFCKLVQDVFSATLFIQFGTASLTICVCLFRFTMPAPIWYYVYLVTYMTVMMVQRAVPCWFGTQIIDKSAYLAYSVYNCDWTPRCRYFKSSLRLFVVRVNRPLNITSGKMVVLSLDTFTSIMNSAYSFFTLLRHMQSREN